MKSIGKGLTAEVFEYSEDKVLKLFLKDYPIEAINREYLNAKLINSFDIQAPQVFEVKNIDDRTGIVYSYIKGQSIESAFNAQVNIEHYLMEFCNLQKSFFQHECESLLSYKVYGECLVNYRSPDEETAETYLKFINSFPDSTTVIHGDYHPMNVLVEEDGGIKVIDFMNVMRGPKEYDIARTYYLIGTSSPEFAEVYLQVMGYKASEISEYIELVKLYRKLEG